MKKLGAQRARVFFTLICLSFVGVTYGKMVPVQPFIKTSKKMILTKDNVAQVLAASASFYEFPTQFELKLKGMEKVQTKIQYSFDAKLQKNMEALFRVYMPDYGAFVALDVKTGRVLSMVSYSKLKRNPDNLALRASFPSASVFKVVTATAAIEEHNILGNTVIPFNGRNHTLYRGQILKSNVTKWTKFMTFKEAFARSVNTVFGRIGAYTVGSDDLRQYAGRFGFNRRIAGDVLIQEGRALIPQDLWGLAESASGFTRDNTMSPLQGALIAASIANDGVMMEPYIVESIVKSDNTVLYAVEPKISSITMDRTTATEIRTLMKETVLHGTSRGSFRGFFKNRFAAVDVGGKTGSLTGFQPRGKYDWFVGYAGSGDHRIALAALTIHEKQWRVKSSYLARLAIEKYFKDIVPHAKTVAKR